MTKLIDTITDRAALSAHVEGILDQCSYDCHHVHGTTTTLAAIIAPNGHVLAVGMSATVFPETYSAELGAEYAKSDAKSKARQVLFETTTWQMRSERFESNNARKYIL